MTAHDPPPRQTALARLRDRALRLLGRGGSRVSARAYATSAPGGRYFHRTLAPATVHRASLPRNVARRDDLPPDRTPWGFSFRDVSCRMVAPRCVARLPECRVVPFRNRWGGEYHEIQTRDGRTLRLRGVGPPRNQSLTRVDGDPVDLGEAAWIVGRWHRNYYHWLVYHLPQILVLQEAGATERMLVPRPGRLSDVIGDSLEALGIDPAGVRAVPEGPLRADPLWIVESDRFDPPLLRALRGRLAAPDGRPSRRVYLSREGAKKRRLADAGGMRAWLDGAGFDEVEAERLTFREQAALAAETRVLMGVHGAGLANMVFMPEGAHVIELAHPRYPSPAFYALAVALGLRYWLLWGTPADERGRNALDVSIAPRDLDRVVEALEATG